MVSNHCPQLMTLPVTGTRSPRPSRRQSAFSAAAVTSSRVDAQRPQLILHTGQLRTPRPKGHYAGTPVTAPSTYPTSFSPGRSLGRGRFIPVQVKIRGCERCVDAC